MPMLPGLKKAVAAIEKRLAALEEAATGRRTDK